MKLHPLTLNNPSPRRVSLCYVPLHETTDIIVNNSDTSCIPKTGLTKDSFKKSLDLASHHSLLTFNNGLYTQTDRVATGSPLGLSYANAFPFHHENKWLVVPDRIQAYTLPAKY